MNPFFTIVTPSFNRGIVLPNAVRSVLLQTFHDFELIIVDDGSTDNTKKHVSAFQDERIQYVYQPNSGVCIARNTGIQASKGKYITFLDSDDVVEPNWLQDFYQSILERETDLVFCDMLLKYPDGRVRVRHALYRYDDKTPNENGMYMPGSFCIKADLLRMIGGFDPNIKFGEFTDIDFALRKEKYTRSFTGKVGMQYCPMPEGGAKNQTNKVAFIEYILKKHVHIFEKDRPTKLCYLQNGGVSSARIHEYAKSRVFFLKAFLLNPFSIKNLFRYAITFFPSIARRVWKL
jgi:glycosyltransferase involved in cell wall biosynthesis